MYFCSLCQKPFTQEASRNRHVSYCRRSQDRPRARKQSCRACSTAKTKCSSQPQCSRCRHKALECVYDHPLSRQSSSAAHDPQKNAVTSPSIAVGPTATTLPQSEFLASDLNLIGDELAWDINSDILQMNPTAPNSVSACDTVSGSTASFPPSVSHEEAQVPEAPVTPPLGELYAAVEPSAPFKSDFFSVLSIPPPVNALETAGFLTPLPMNSPVAQSNAHYIIQMLRPFPQLMLQKSTFPPFIHPLSHRGGTDDTHPLVQTPLANCMSIAQMFAPRTAETKPFVWKTIRTEQRRLVDEMETFGREEVLAAIQAYIVYIIMRIVDDSLQHSENDLHMLLSFQLLCERFRKICAQPFALDEQANPSSSWQDWIFAESRRRVACLWFLISRVICVKTGIPCDTTEVFRALPLPSSRALWAADTQESWEMEYRASQISFRRRMAYFGELIEAQRRSGDVTMAQKLDIWHTEADHLGIMLMLATAMV